MKKAGKQILLFGGTTEGRKAAEKLLEAGVPCTVCVATEYGKDVLQPHPLLRVHIGRMDRTQITELIQMNSFACVIDATHPHAQAVKEEIRAGCKQTGLPYLRLQRAMDLSAGDSADPSSDVIYVSDIEEAGGFLASAEGSILVTTGSKEIEKLARCIKEPARLFARVLPSAGSVEACMRAGLSGRQILAMQGPFDRDMNAAMIRHTGVSWLLTKETGRAGGYYEKLAAAEQCGIKTVVIRSPETASLQTAAEKGPEPDTALKNFEDPADGTMEAVIGKALDYVKEASCTAAAAGDAGCCPAGLPEYVKEASCTAADVGDAGCRLSLVGIGVGAEAARTKEAEEALSGAEVIFGAESVLRNLREDSSISAPDNNGRTWVPVYEGKKILLYLKEHPEIRRAAAAYSGDSGFYSGASSFLSAFREQEVLRHNDPQTEGKEKTGAGSLQIRLVCGISCVSWFAARAGMPWQDWKILSSHGRSCNIIGQVRKHPKCFLLLSGAEELKRTGEMLFEAQKREILGDLKLLYGYELSRPGEKICACTPEELSEAGICADRTAREEAARTEGPHAGETLRTANIPCSEKAARTSESPCAEEAARTADGGYDGSPEAGKDNTCCLRQGLYVLLIEHPDALSAPVVPGLPDSAFLRGKAPMTSAEVRALSLCRLGLTSGAIVWDVGAGTGSVSIEAAMTCPEGRIWSVEYKKDALDLLRRNRDKYCLSNMETVEGRAPDALRDLPAPTHVFIGGSGGEIGGIIELALEKSPEARFVANCITAETLLALYHALAEMPVGNLQCTQISVQRMEELGRYHYLKAQNPVFIISFQGMGKNG